MSSATPDEQARMAPMARVAEMAAVFSGLVWPVPQDDVPAVVARLGWSVIPGSEGEFLKADSGWDLARTDSRLSSDNGELTSVSTWLCDPVLDPVEWRVDFLRDVFAAAVSAVSAVLGQPSTRTRGKEPAALWELSNGGRFQVSTLAAGVVTATVASAEWADVDRQNGR